MNAADRKEFDIIDAKHVAKNEELDEMKHEMSMAHGKSEESLRFIKETLFNPHEGLWAETKDNTRYRQDSQKWRMTIGAGFIGLFFKQIYDFFNL